MKWTIFWLIFFSMWLGYDIGHDNTIGAVIDTVAITFNVWALHREIKEEAVKKK